MRTLVVSDLHLGATKRTDLARRPELREPLLEAVRGVDRLVILGDAVELRDRPKRDIAELAEPCAGRPRRRAGARRRADPDVGQPRPRARRGLDRGAPRDRAVGLPRPRAAHRAARRGPARRGARPLRPARAHERRLPRRVAARGRVRPPRALLGPARHRPHVRAARHRRDGALGRAAAGGGRGGRRLRGRARPAVRVDERAHPALRPRGALGRGGRLGAGVGDAGGWGAAPPPGARRRARRRLRGDGGRPQRRRARAARARPLRRVAAPRLPARDPRGAAPARRHGAVRAVGPLAPLRTVGRRRPGGVDDPGRHPHHQHGLVGLPAPLPLREPELLALLARHRRPARGFDPPTPPRLIRLLGDRGHRELEPPPA